MRYFLIVVLSLLSVKASMAEGRRPLPLPKVRYESLGTSWSGDSLMLHFRVSIEGDVPGRGTFMGIIPDLGTPSVEFPGVGYFRTSDLRYYRRRRALDEATAPRLAYELAVARRGARQSVDYTYSMVVPSSVEVSEVKLETRMFRCGDSKSVSWQTVAVGPRPRLRDTVYMPGMPSVELPRPVAVVSVPLYEANVTFLKPRPEKIKERVARVVIRITYPVNVWRVMPSFEQNGAELRRIDGILRPVATDTTTYRVVKTNIVGYASPEGTYAYNLSLSDRRATGMRDWLVEKYGMDKGDISTSGVGEDWVGLRDSVVHSDMEYKNEVLAIIDRYGIHEGREKHLMDLRVGRPYNYMMEHFFPSLRRMELEMIYTVRAFSQSESDMLLDERPQDLSLQEMYDVARERNTDQTIVHQRTEYGKEYDIAVRYFPNDAIANINAASAALVRGDLEQARKCLENVSDDPLAANNLGVYYWLCGDPQTAEKYFQRARESDPVRAEYNLRELTRWREEQQEQSGQPSEQQSATQE